MTWSGSRLLKHMLQVGFFWIAVGTCVSRISDYKHHWSDVLAGAFIGVVTAILCVSIEWNKAFHPGIIDICH